MMQKANIISCRSNPKQTLAVSSISTHIFVDTTFLLNQRVDQGVDARQLDARITNQNAFRDKVSEKLFIYNIYST